MLVAYFSLKLKYMPKKITLPLPEYVNGVPVKMNYITNGDSRLN